MNPPDRGDGLSADVARILDVIDRSGVSYQLTPMGTILEGSFDEVPPRQNSCRPDRTRNQGAAMKDASGSIRTSIQRQSGSEVAAAGERGGGSCCA